MMDKLIKTLLKEEETLKAASRFNKRAGSGFRLLGVLLCLSLVCFSGCSNYEASPDFRPTKGQMVIPRSGHHAVLLQDGKVLILGGYTEKPNIGAVPTLEAEIYNPKTEQFSPVGKMHFFHEGGTVTLLNDGRVLVVGGSDHNQYISPKVEIYEPALHKFIIAHSMVIPRLRHAATLLPDGKVLITGGRGYSCAIFKGEKDCGEGKFLKSQEIYDPKIGNFQLTKSLLEAHSELQTFLLNQHEILIIGTTATDINTILDKNVEIYNFDTKKSRFLDYSKFNSIYYTSLLISPNNLLRITECEANSPKGAIDTNFNKYNEKSQQFEKKLTVQGSIYYYCGSYTDFGKGKIFCFHPHETSIFALTRAASKSYSYIYDYVNNQFINVGKFPVKWFDGYSLTPINNNQQILIVGYEKSSSTYPDKSHYAWLYDPKHK